MRRDNVDFSIVGVVAKRTGTQIWKKHRRRHCPRLMGEQRDIPQNVEGEWLVAAMDKVYWASRDATWIERKDVPWASGSQFALEC